MTHACERPTGGNAPLMAAQLRAAIPALDTVRLHLRAPLVEDFQAYADIVCSERGRYMGGPMDRDDAWYDFLSLSSGWVLHGHGGWVITDRTTSQTLGFVMVALEPGDHEPELGYLLCADAEGQGYAFEAATAARTFARDHLQIPALVSYIDTDNTRSRALASRLGAADDGTVEDNQDFHVHRHWGPAA